jgi:hypothetical protein
MRSVSSRLIASPVRSSSLAVRGDSWLTIYWACSMCPTILQVGGDAGGPARCDSRWFRAIRPVGRTILARLAGPANAAQVAGAFAAAPPDRVAELLETLVTLGQARQTVEARFVG